MKGSAEWGGGNKVDEGMEIRAEGEAESCTLGFAEGSKARVRERVEFGAEVVETLCCLNRTVSTYSKELWPRKDGGTYLSVSNAVYYWCHGAAGNFFTVQTACYMEFKQHAQSVFCQIRRVLLIQEQSRKQ